jgi:hypothetical protein
MFYFLNTIEKSPVRKSKRNITKINIQMQRCIEKKAIPQGK